MELQRRAATVGQRFLTFEIEGEVYAIPILKVKEILGLKEITPLPETPPSVAGVINLRGMIIPVVDLRLRFGLPVREPTKQTSIVVLDLLWEGEPLLIGAIVDRVLEVQAIADDKVSRLSNWQTRVKARYVQGVADTAAGLRILIDAEQILTEDELTSFEQVTHSLP